ncbi:hypothetical protein EDB19DRAFT_1954539 [Suillus lakei]|nr:hypothetical protein EDB19DRAFT_1954539 [Suillus lakei]
MSSRQTLAQMNLTCIWLEAILYGRAWVNLNEIHSCMLFGSCVHGISIGRPAHRLLLFATSFQFAMATAHVILMFVQAMIAFTNTTIAATPDGASLYYATTGGNHIFLASQSVYIINVTLSKIWRLYIIWNQNFKVCILPVIRSQASIAVALLAPKNATIFSHTFRVFALSGWSLEMILNVTVTAGIVYHIWRTGQQTASLTSRFRYRNTIMAIVESGALITVCTCVMFCLWVAGDVAGTVAIDIAIQVVTMTPLLIIVRAGLERSHSKLESSGRYSSPHLEVNVVRSQITVSDYAMDVIPKGKGAGRRLYSTGGSV